jgi:hypothetical protein
LAVIEIDAGRGCDLAYSRIIDAQHIELMPKETTTPLVETPHPHV